MKYLFRTIGLSAGLLLAGMLFAQSGTERHMPHYVNLSLWKGVSTQSPDTLSGTWLNLGVFSYMNALHGAGINIVGSSVRRDVCGMQVAGIFNVVQGRTGGLQIAGISNVNGRQMRGVSLSGLVGIHGDRTGGIVMSGLANIAGNRVNGLVAGGLLNIMGDDANGVQISGLGSVTGGSHNGLSLSGFLNVSGKEMRGMQVAGLGNITAGDMSGMQLSALGNVAGGTMRGVQLAPLNMAMRAKGVQIGLVNYYKEKLDGLQLGLVNANPHTRVQMMLFGGNTTKLNVGARFKNNSLYTIVGGGTHYLDFSDRFSAALFYRAGMEHPLSKSLSVSGDLGYQHVETFKNRHIGFPSRLYALQARVNLEYRFSPSLGAFVTGGYNNARRYGHSSIYEKGAIIEAGVVCFKY